MTVQHGVVDGGGDAQPGVAGTIMTSGTARNHRWQNGPVHAEDDRERLRQTFDQAQRAWQALRPGGHLAFWTAGHVFPEGGDPFFAEIQDIYDEIGEALPPGTPQPRPGELADERAGIEASGLFEVTAVRHYDWDRVYPAEEYIELLETFSGHLVMAEWKRRRLYGEIRRRLALRRDHAVRRGWGAVLHVARRLG